MIALIFLIVVVAAVLAWTAKRRNIPAYKGDGFFHHLNDAYEYAMTPVDLVRKATVKCGNIFSIQVLTVHNVWLRGNHLNKVYLDTREDVWSFGGGMGLFLNKILDPGYMDHLRIFVGSLSKYINRAAAQEYATLCTEEETQKAATKWAAEQDVEIFDAASGLAHNIIVKTLMGNDFYEHSSEELGQLLHDMETDIGSILSFILPDWIPHPPARRLQKARERVKEIFFERLAQRPSFEGKKISDAPDYITYTLNDPVTAPLKHLMPSHHTILIFAAHTSTVSEIAWVIVSLLRNPTLLKAIQDELRAGAENSVLLQACIMETSRYHSGIRTLRLAKKQHTIPGTDMVVPAGAVVSISPYLTHRDPENFAEPNSWLPGRWINENNELIRIDNKSGDGVKFMPFGAGSHRCPGEKMATIMVTRSLTTLLRDYDVNWASPEVPQTVDFDNLDFDKIGSPWLKGGARVRITRRAEPEATIGEF